MDIRLAQIYPIEQPSRYKLHVACWDGSNQPLDVFVRNREGWNNWNRWRGARNDFNRQFIFSLIDFYPERDSWLFGGAYQVLSRENVNRAFSYEIELLEESVPFIGRLKISLSRPGRARAVKFENHYDGLVVSEILPVPYSGDPFRGYDQIDLSFPMLENIFSVQRPDWKAALENTKGVYLITDTGNGKRYVGSAYGDTGIWSRWDSYVRSGHGGNDELVKVIKRSGMEYARKNFRFAMLESINMKTDDDVLIRREQHWKRVLLTQGDYGYNKN